MTEVPTPESQRSAEVRFGAWLREQRELRGVEVTYVATFTRLSQGQIEALENGAWERFAAGVYLRGAVMNYARAIGADAEEIVSRLQIEVPEAFGPTATAETHLPEALTEAPRKARRSLLLAGIALAVGILALLFWAALERERTRDLVGSPTVPDVPERPAAVTHPEETTGATTAPTSISFPAAQPATSTPAPVEPRLHRVQLRAGADSWVEVQADDAAPKNLILRKGRRLTIEARRNVRIRAGNAGGVTVVVDGVAVAEPMGPAGAVRERMLSLE